jgi:hypothetical protein
MPFDPTKPANSSQILSTELRNQFNGLKALIDALTAQVNALLPLGIICGWHKSLGAMPPLPGTWVECNGQVLSDPESPFDGVTLPDLNNASGFTTPAFLRGGMTSGTFGGAIALPAGDVTVDNNADGSTVSVLSGSESFAPYYYEVVWVMRVK